MPQTELAQNGGYRLLGSRTADPQGPGPDVTGAPWSS